MSGRRGPAKLRELRIVVIEERVAGLRGDAEAEHMGRLMATLDAADARCGT